MTGLAVPDARGLQGLLSGLRDSRDEKTRAKTEKAIRGKQVAPL